MDNNLTRFQVYLDTRDVSRLTEIAGYLKVTRSQIIREATKAVATRYAEIIGSLTKDSKKANPLLDLIGTEKSKTGIVGLNPDEIYKT